MNCGFCIAFRVCVASHTTLLTHLTLMHGMAGWGGGGGGDGVTWLDPSTSKIVSCLSW